MCTCGFTVSFAAFILVNEQIEKKLLIIYFLSFSIISFLNIGKGKFNQSIKQASEQASERASNQSINQSFNQSKNHSITQ